MNPSQATIDILNNPRFEGAIDSISWMTSWMDIGFTTVITLVAFFIMSAAMLKNVLAGAYCAFPKFWDKVDAVHKKDADKGWIQRAKGTFSKAGMEEINMGTISETLLRMLPNIKVLTDFEEDTVSYKQYFLRAIPQMCIIVIIGAFIYNSYYRDVAGKVVDFGSELTHRVLLEADPIALFDRLTSSSGTPNFATDDAVTDYDKFVYKASTSVYNAVIGTYTDVDSGDQKSALALSIEGWVMPFVKENEKYVGKPEWKAQVSSTLVLGKPDLTYIHQQTSDNGLTYQAAYCKPVSEFNMQSTKEVGKDWYVRCIMTFKKQAPEKIDPHKLNITLTLPPSSYSCGSGSTVFRLPTGSVPEGTGWGETTSAIEQAVIDGMYVKTPVENGKFRIEKDCGKLPADSDLSFSCSIRYNVGGKTHSVTKIVISHDAKTPTFSASGVPDFTFTSGPNFNAKEETEKEKT